MVNISHLKKFWKGKKVFITGHTGFKGSWLIIILNLLGAKVYGYSLKPKKNSLFNQINGSKIVIKNFYQDIKNLKVLKSKINLVNPNIIFHMAAQPLVLESFKKPLDTLHTNIIGSANLMEASRNIKSLKSIVIVTSDKVYKIGKNNNYFSEEDELGGDDPYSASKAGTEIIVNTYIKSFFSNSKLKNSISTARSGNVVGGGDYSKNRLVPDIIESFNKKKKLVLRNPKNIRPWQHVIEPLIGYILLAQKQISGKINDNACWNFGPNRKNFLKAKDIVNIFKKLINFNVKTSNTNKFHETKILKLNNSKSLRKLKWAPKWNMDIVSEKVTEWNKLKKKKVNVRNICEMQVRSYFKD